MAGDGSQALCDEGACACLELMEREMDRIYEVPWRKLTRPEDGKGR